ncbi:hypothetical protein [Thalassotalea ganghwensis]
MNSTTEVTHSTKEFLKEQEEVVRKMDHNRHNILSAEDFQRRYRQIIISLVEDVAKNPDDLEKIIEDIQSPNVNHRTGYGYNLQNLQNNYSVVKRHLEELLDKDKQVSRLEREAHTRNIISRGITTLVIGFSIMIVYGVAHCFGIPMPMLRLPAS